ncbi:MAG: hypothetical protein K2J58_07615 [Muribaculaceae bacterium]|nr:hypothetical protein [Muribaculaceae bacterium]
MKYSRNPITGRLSSGYRFKFKVPSIDSRTLYLPLEMKTLPSVRQVMQGVSPLVVLNALDLADAHSRFRSLRKKYDFDYWAVKEYFIQDILNPDSIVPLRLNDAQFHVIDILRKRYFLHKGIP